MGDPRNGDHISVGSLTNAQGVAVGRGAQAHVTGSAINVGAAKEVDPKVLRAVLTELYAVLGRSELPVEAAISTQTAVGNALQHGVGGDKVEPEAVVTNVEKVGEALKLANVAVKEGSALWESVQKLAPVLGPLVAGGPKAVAAWFGVPL